MSMKSYTKTRFSAKDAALVLIDHQSGIMQLVHDYSRAEFRNNVLGLAKLGRVFKLPTVLTTSLGQGPNGPLIPEVVSVILADYATLMVEIMKDNARADAASVYAAIDIDRAKLVGQIAQAYGK